MSDMYSVIIPLDVQERSFTDLLADLSLVSRSSQVDSNFEIIFVVADTATEVDLHEIEERALEFQNSFFEMKVVTAPRGRALQLNFGASISSGDFLWFVHADSRFDSVELLDLFGNNSFDKKKLYYFNLKFLNDGPLFMGVNRLGVLIRSEIFKIPFGDQAFLIHRDLFTFVGKFPENVVGGEDHHFIWRARNLGVALLSCKSSVSTSARKYKRLGWAKTTWQHLYLTGRVAISYWIENIKLRYL
jgi:hypothetical protein